LISGTARAHGKASGDKGIVGRIIDSTCLARGEEPDAEHTECASRCIQGGAPIALIEDKTRAVYVAVAAPGQPVKDRLLAYVGPRLEIGGRVVKRGGTQFVVVDRVVREHEHTPHEGGVVAMAGNLHLEVKALPSGEVRVYLSDAFRKPVSTTGRTGAS